MVYLPATECVDRFRSLLPLLVLDVPDWQEHIIIAHYCYLGLIYRTDSDHGPWSAHLPLTYIWILGLCLDFCHSSASLVALLIVHVFESPRIPLSPQLHPLHAVLCLVWTVWPPPT